MNKSWLWIILLGLFTISPLFASDLIGNAIKLKLDRDPYWLKLLYYRGDSSYITDVNFFIDKEGKHDSKKELIATINELMNADNQVACRFPARKEWLSKKLKVSFPEIKCPELDEYMAAMNNDAISLLFAAERITDPTSMVGHIFLKIGDMAVSYYAETAGAIPILFHMQTILYHVNGILVLRPLSMFLREYLHQEGRSIWEYQLNFPAEIVQSIRLHLWELRGIDIKYNFLFNNCIQVISHLISLGYEGPLKTRFMATPTEMIKSFYDIGLVGNMTLYPSYSYLLKMHNPNYSYKDRRKIIKYFKDEDISNIAESANSNNLLYLADLASSYAIEQGKMTSEKYDRLQLEIQKAKTGDFIAPTFEKNVLRTVPPGSLGLYYQNNDLYFNFRLAYHDISNNSNEYYDEFMVNFVNVFLKVKPLDISELNLLQIKLLSPSDSLLKNLSGSMDFRFIKENNKLIPNLDFGIGKTGRFGNLYLYGLAHVGIMNKPYISPEIGMIIRYQNMKSILSVRQYFGNKYSKLEYSLSHNIYLKNSHQFSVYFNNTYKAGLSYNYLF